MRTTTVLVSPDRRGRQKRGDLEKMSHRDDLTRWDDEGGAPRSGHHFGELSPSRAQAETALYYFNIRTESGLVEDPEGNRYPDLLAARNVALAMAHDMMVEGDQKGEDRRSWRVEIMDRANQQVLTVAFSEAHSPTAPRQPVSCCLGAGRETAIRRAIPPPGEL